MWLFEKAASFDVVVNILTNLAYHTKEITVFGGSQLRPNIHIDDMVDAYLLMLEAPKSKIAGQKFNVGSENHTVIELAEMVKREVGKDVKLVVSETNDLRSYHISSKKIFKNSILPHLAQFARHLRTLVKLFRWTAPKLTRGRALL